MLRWQLENDGCLFSSVIIYLFVFLKPLLPPSSETLAIACIGQEVSTELELGHGCRVYG